MASFRNPQLRLIVLLGTIVWGIGLTSARFFLFPAPAHSCCNPLGKARNAAGKTPARNACQVYPAEAGLSASPMHAPASAVVFQGTPAELGAAHVAPFEAANRLLTSAPPGHSPPDRQSLHSVFLI